MLCPRCGEDLDGAELTLPWEDGDNESAYLTCPNCGCHVEVDGYGEDDE